MIPQFHEDLVASANSLPPLPQTVCRLNEILADPEYDLGQVISTLEIDGVLIGKLLKLANSAVYGQRPVTGVRQAVIRLGEGTVKAVAIAASLRPPKAIDLSAFGLTPDSYWQHSIAVMCFAEALAALSVADFTMDFPTAGLFHDFGKLVLSKHLTPAHVLALENLSPMLRPVDREHAVLTVNHAEVTALVSQAWKLPDSLRLAVQYHHAPSDCGSPMCHGLNLANQLAWRLEERESEHETDIAVKAESLNALGVTEEQLEAAYFDGLERFESAQECFTAGSA
ncbi:MAG: HDOD domain-containing protein [Planctomycetaceae bacterium]